MGGFGVERELTLGDADLVDEIADELIEWMWPPGMAGKPPSRRPVLAQAAESMQVEVL